MLNETPSVSYGVVTCHMGSHSVTYW